MEGLLILAAVLIGALVFVGPIVSLVWLLRLSRQQGLLARRLEEIEARGVRPERTGAEPEDVVPPPPGPETGPTEAADEAAAAARVGGPWAVAKAGLPRPPTATAAASATARTPPPERRNIEEILAASWMIWLGGVAVALAAVFLFRYAVDQGWLTPFTRVVVGLGLGGLLLGAGEWTVRTPPEGARRVVNPDYVPPALSAAGIFALLVSLYAAHGLYGFLGPAGAFVAMAMVVYAALALALRQGWFVALLGLLAGYLVPALIVAPEANAVATFVYLYVLTAGALALMVWRRWWWFSFLTIAGALVWPVLWILERGALADQGALGGYALALAATFGALSVRLPVAELDIPAWKWIGAVVAETSGLGFALCGALLVVMALAADFNAGAFATLVAYAIVALGLGYWRPALEGLLAVAAIVALAALLIWPQPFDVSVPERVQDLGVASVSNAFGPYVMPPEFVPFSRALWAFAAVFGIGGFLSLSRVSAKAAWAALSALMPPVLFAVGYWRIGAFEIDIAWAYWAIGLAGLLLLAAAATARRPLVEGRNVALAYYAAGVTGAVALAFACLLREAWLTVALSAEVAAIAWVWSLLRVRGLKAVALAVLAVVVVRLVANPLVLDYDGTLFGTFGWVIYGYGLPAVFAFGASRIFARETTDLVVTFSEIAAVGLAFLMVALQLKLWTSGSIYTADWSLLDRAVQANWWLVSGALLLRTRFTATRTWAPAVGMAVVFAASAVVFLGALIGRNPLLFDEPVGRWPLFNLLALAFLVPAVLLGILAMSSRFEILREVRRFLIAASGVLVFAYITLEVRRAFWGSAMSLTQDRFPTGAEIYAYSAVWIVFALVLLGLGIVRSSLGLRYASLAVLMVTVAKVFLYDMSDLTGLYRVASFLGLGLTLIGIGRLYRVYVFRPGAEPGPGQTPDAGAQDRGSG